MTSPGWDDYVAGGDLGITAGESDVAYAGFDAASASAVTTDIVDGVLADEVADGSVDTEPAGTEPAGTEPAGTAAAQDWADWNNATADEGAFPGDGHVETPEGYIDLVTAALDHAEYADHHDTAAADHGYDLPGGDVS